MNKKDLEAFAREAAKHMKTEKDLSDFSQMLTKITLRPPSTVSLMRTLATKNIKNRLPPIAVMATPPKHSKPKMANLNYKRRVIETVVLSRS